jgi:hypothetical protein
MRRAGCRGWQSNPGPPEYEVGVLTTRQRRSVFSQRTWIKALAESWERGIKWFRPDSRLTRMYGYWIIFTVYSRYKASLEWTVKMETIRSSETLVNTYKNYATQKKTEDHNQHFNRDENLKYTSGSELHYIVLSRSCCCWCWRDKTLSLSLSELRPPTGLLSILQMIHEEPMEPRRNSTERGKPKNSEKELSQCDFAHHKSYMDWPGREPKPSR